MMVEKKVHQHSVKKCLKTGAPWSNQITNETRKAHKKGMFMLNGFQTKHHFEPNVVCQTSFFKVTLNIFAKQWGEFFAGGLCFKFQ